VTGASAASSVLHLSIAPAAGGTPSLPLSTCCCCCRHGCLCSHLLRISVRLQHHQWTTAPQTGRSVASSAHGCVTGSSFIVNELHWSLKVKHILEPTFFRRDAMLRLKWSADRRCGSKHRNDGRSNGKMLPDYLRETRRLSTRLMLMMQLTEMRNGCSYDEEPFLCLRCGVWSQATASAASFSIFFSSFLRL